MKAVGEARKASNITIFLFGKPAWELDLEGRDADREMVDELGRLGDELKSRLDYISGLTKTLLENGWSGSGGLYDIYFRKDVAVEEARVELERLGVETRGLDIEEEEPEEE